MPVAASTNALTTVADVKYTWGRKQEDTSYDDRIQTLINNISGRIESWCGRKFKAATYTDEIYDVPRGKFFFLKQYPIIGTPVVKLDDVEIAAAEYEVYPEEGYLLGAWDCGDGVSFPGRRTYKVTYEAGFTEIPAGLSEICIEWIIILLEGRMKDAMVDHAEVTYEPQSLITGLAPWKRMDF